MEVGKLGITFKLARQPFTAPREIEQRRNGSAHHETLTRILFTVYTVLFRFLSDSPVLSPFRVASAFSARYA